MDMIAGNIKALYAKYNVLPAMIPFEPASADAKKDGGQQQKVLTHPFYSTHSTAEQ